MPGGIPVATMAIGKAGAKNAALMAIRILSLEDAIYERSCRPTAKRWQGMLKKDRKI